MAPVDFETVRLDGEGAVRHLVLNRPRVHNAVNRQLISDVHQACLVVDADPTIRVVIVRGEGPSFCSGADLKEPGSTSAQAMRSSKDGARMYDTLLNLTAITIACLHGHCIGGGAVFPAACDFRIGSPSVKLTINEVSIGFNLTWHSIPALMAVVGPQKAKEMVILGRTYTTPQLDALGFFTEVVTSEDALIPAAERLASEVVRQPPVPTALTKASVNAEALAHARAIQHMDHLAIGYMGKSANSRVARRSYFDSSDRVYEEE